MTQIVTGVQVEVLEGNVGPVTVSTAILEINHTQAPQPVAVHAQQVEVVHTQPPQKINAHALQVEVVHTQPPQPIVAQSAQIEVLAGQDVDLTPVKVQAVTLEVLRTIEGKKRRPPMNVVAN